MARPQTENLKAFDVPRKPWTAKGLPAGAEIRELCRDPDNGAVSALIHLPKGWSLPGGYCTADQDFFVFDGELTVDGIKYANGGFCFYPAGVAHGGWTVAADATVYVIYNREPSFTAANNSQQVVCHSPSARSSCSMTRPGSRFQLASSLSMNTGTAPV